MHSRPRIQEGSGVSSYPLQRISTFDLFYAPPYLWSDLSKVRGKWHRQSKVEAAEGYSLGDAVEGAVQPAIQPRSAIEEVVTTFLFLFPRQWNRAHARRT